MECSLPAAVYTAIQPGLDCIEIHERAASSGIGGH